MKWITLLFILCLFINGVFGDEVSVMEGDSVTLHTNTVIQAFSGVSIIWKFGAKRIAHINKANNNNTVSKIDDDLDGKFRGRLQLNDQTGDLTITNITTTDSGLYVVDIHGSKETQKKSFDVKGVSNPESDHLKSVSVKDGDSVTLHTDDPDIQKYDVIQWRFKGIPIAHFNKSASEISEDERFRDKPQLDVQTGSLKIKNLRMDLSGLYEVDLTSSSYSIHQSFTVTVSGEVKSVSVMKGDPLTINTDVPDIKSYDQILLILGCDDRIAEVNNQNKKFTLYGENRDRLKLNDQTGDLTITDIRYEDAGDYELKMSSRRRSIQRRFRVNVSGLSPGVVAIICVSIILLPAAAAGVIYHRLKVKMTKVNEGESVPLKTEVTDINRVGVMLWYFSPGEPTGQIWPMLIDAMKRVFGFSRINKTPIAEINPVNSIIRKYDGDYGEFRGKLELNDQTGDLTINDIREKHTGVYILKIIRGGKTTEKRFRVIVRGEIKPLQVYKGESVDLKTEVTDIQRVDLIEWRFRETLIAEINPANNIFSIYEGDDDLFKYKLKLNHETGDLNIKDFKQEHEGVYILKIIRDGETSYKRFRVIVRAETKILDVDEWKSADLKTEVKDIKRDDVIEWRFGETLIAEINPANNIFRTYDGDDDLFRDKLKLNHQTGDLTIKDIRQKHRGVYLLTIIRDGETSYKTISVFVKCHVEVLRVDEWKSVPLKTEVTDIQRVQKIEWRFENEEKKRGFDDEETLIAEINPASDIFSTYDGDKGLFRGKLKLDCQTGDLHINNIRSEQRGEYILKIIRDGKTSYRRFRVIVRDKMEPFSVYEGESFNLETKLKDMHGYDVIEWRFGETLIAKINPANNIFNTYDDDDLFRDKLKLNHQTGDLTINDIREKHSGVYTLRRITYGVPPFPQRYFVLVKAVGDSEEKRGKDSEKRGKDSEKRGKDSEKKTGKDSARKREEDSVRIEMQPLLNKHSQ